MSGVPFTRLDEGEEFEIDTVHEGMDATSGARNYFNNGEAERRIDYVLVYETPQDDETSEDSAAHAERLALSRTNFEKQLEKQGLVLQRRTSAAQKVRGHVYFLRLIVFIVPPVLAARL